MLVVALQWDETSQRTRPQRQLLQRVVGGQQQSSAQCMAIRADLWLEDPASWHVQHVPLTKRCLRLEAQHANALAEGVLTQLPVALEDPEAAWRLKSAHSQVLLCLGMDRASANWGVVRYLTDLTHRQALRERLLVWAEPCALHGVALVRSRCQCSKRLASALYSLSRWLRLSRNLQAFAGALESAVAARIQVVEAPRPQRLRRQAQLVASALFGDTAEVLYRESGAKTPFHQALERLVERWDFNAETEAITVWNYVALDSAEEQRMGRAVGSRVTQNRAQAAAHASEPLLALLTGFAWPAGAQSRWTHFAAVVRRVLLGFLAKGVLPEALRQLGAQAPRGSAAALRQAVREDREDFASLNSLRLLRIAGTLGDASVGLRLACMVETSAPVQALQRQLMASESLGLRLADMLDPERSPLLAAQGSLLGLLQAWTWQSWPLLGAFGADLGVHHQEPCSHPCRVVRALFSWVVTVERFCSQTAALVL